MRTTWAVPAVLSVLSLVAVGCDGGSSPSAATDLPATDPPAAEPPVTDPPVTDPPVTDPPVTDPPVTDPPVTDPAGPTTMTFLDGVVEVTFPAGMAPWELVATPPADHPLGVFASLEIAPDSGSDGWPPLGESRTEWRGTTMITTLDNGMTIVHDFEVDLDDSDSELPPLEDELAWGRTDTPSGGSALRLAHRVAVDPASTDENLVLTGEPQLLQADEAANATLGAAERLARAWVTQTSNGIRVVFPDVSASSPAAEGAVINAFVEMTFPGGGGVLCGAGRCDVVRNLNSFEIIGSIDYEPAEVFNFIGADLRGAYGTDGYVVDIPLDGVRTILSDSGEPPENWGPLPTTAAIGLDAFDGGGSRVGSRVLVLSVDQETAIDLAMTF